MINAVNYCIDGEENNKDEVKAVQEPGVGAQSEEKETLAQKQVSVVEESPEGFKKALIVEEETAEIGRRSFNPEKVSDAAIMEGGTITEAVKYYMKLGTPK